MVYICVRQTLDWSDRAAVEAGLIPSFRPKFDAWNDTFTLPYAVFRQRLKSIAESNLARVDGAILARIDEVPPGNILLPVDDDDWIAPDAAARLSQAHDPRADGYLWRRELLEHRSLETELRRRVARMLGRGERYLCKTNNYGVASAPSLVPLALNHVHASEYFEAHAASIVRLDAVLAVQNRNMASQTALAWKRPSISRRELVVLLEKYRAVYRTPRLSAEVAWARPCVEQMRDLMADVRVMKS